MKEKVEKIIERERIIPKEKYEQPFIVLLTGQVGSGKSLVASLISQELSLYLISGDYIRNKMSSIDKDIDINTVESKNLVNVISINEINYCLKNQYAIIIDRNVSSQKDLDYINKKIAIPYILIKLISDDTENIKRVEQRKIKKDLNFPHYGHPETKSGVATKEEYQQIKDRKVYDFSDEVYDYFLDTNVSLETLIKDIKKIAEQIKIRI